MGFGTRYTTGGLGSPVVSIEPKITYTPNALVSAEEPADPEEIYPRDCVRVIITDVSVYKGKGGYFAQGTTSLECCCASIKEVLFSNPNVSMNDAPFLFTGSIDENNLRFLQVKITLCCTPCAIDYPGDAGGTVTNDDCTCKLEGRDSISFGLNITKPEQAERNVLQAAGRAYDQLSNCEHCDEKPDFFTWY